MIWRGIYIGLTCAMLLSVGFYLVRWSCGQDRPSPGGIRYMGRGIQPVGPFVMLAEPLERELKGDFA